MLWTLVVILVLLWAVGMVSSYTMGGLVHILLVIAIVVVLFRVIQGRKVVSRSVPPRGIDPPANSLGNCCSIQLSYGGVRP